MEGRGEDRQVGVWEGRGKGDGRWVWMCERMSESVDGVNRSLVMETRTQMLPPPAADVEKTSPGQAGETLEWRPYSV